MTERHLYLRKFEETDTPKMIEEMVSNYSFRSGALATLIKHSVKSIEELCAYQADTEAISIAAEMVAEMQEAIFEGVELLSSALRENKKQHTPPVPNAAA